MQFLNSPGILTAGTNITLSGSGTSGSPYAVSSNSSTAYRTITQTAHGFSVGQVLKFTGTAYALAQADTAANAEVVGIISAVTTNTFDLVTNGYVSTLSGLVAGSVYFLSPSSAGALTATEPTTVGQVRKPLTTGALSTTELNFQNFEGVVIATSTSAGIVTIQNFRLTTETGVSVSTSDRIAQSTLYFTPHAGNQIALYNGTSWSVYVSAEISLALTGLTSGKNYDVFAYWTGSAVALELSTAWTSDTARATALVRQDGIWAKSGTLTRRYVGTIRATAAQRRSQTQMPPGLCGITITKFPSAAA